MALWGNVDNAANSTIFAASQVKLTPNTDNQVLLFNNTTSDLFVTGAKVGQFGIDTNEQQQSVASSTERPTHAGWVLRTEGSGLKAGRVHYETLVAMGSMTGDASNTILPQQAIVISSQPSDASANSTAGDTATFTVAATLQPSGGSITYKWQADGVDVVNGGSWANSGVTSATLTVGTTTGLNGKKFRAVLSKAGATTVNSANATLTVTT